MSVMHARALPPAFSIASHAVKTVPGSLGCGSAVLATTAMFAPSRAARRAMANPMPRLAPVMNKVFPLRVTVKYALFSHFQQEKGHGGDRQQPPCSFLENLYLPDHGQASAMQQPGFGHGGPLGDVAD